MQFYAVLEDPVRAPFAQSLREDRLVAARTCGVRYAEHGFDRGKASIRAFFRTHTYQKEFSVPMRVCQQESPPPALSIAPIDGATAGALTAEHPGGHQRGLIQITFDILPGDVLLEIFRFYLLRFDFFNREAAWRGLVQVCQRWRNLVFESPLHLGVSLRCSARTALRELLDVWPALPISIYQNGCSELSQVELENVLVILELHQRVYEIDLKGVSNMLLERVGQIMRNPYPALTKLRVLLESSSPDPFPPVLPNSFLGGSAPRLRELELGDIPFPALPLLLSTTYLRHLSLFSIPLSADIPSRVMVTCLSGMTRLKSLVVKFQSPRFLHGQASLPLPPSTRAVLPALTYLRFRGMCTYFEDLVASIDAPLLNKMSLSIFKRDTYYTPQISKFISFTNRLQSPCRVDAVFYDHTIKIKLYLQARYQSDSAVDLEVIPRDSEGRLLSLARLSLSCLAFLPTLEDLDIRRRQLDRSSLPYDIQNAEWLEFLRRFAGVKNLHITCSLGLPVMSAMTAFPGEVTVLPALQNIFLEGLQPSGHLRDAVDKLIAARQLSGQSISVHNWDME